jgi:hypothetical protein
MSLGSVIRTAALVLLSGSTGWVLHALTATPDQAPTPAPAEEKPRGSLMAFPQSASDADADVVQLNGDGSATIRVQRRPPGWVVSELCRQGARDVAGCARDVAQASSPGGAAQTPSTTPQPPGTGDEQILRRLKDPNEQARFQGLMQAREEGVLVPKATLLALMRNDPSERVRLEAFEDYVDASSDTTQELRAAMQELMRIPDATLQSRAREQLDLLEQAEREDAEMNLRQR